MKKLILLLLIGAAGYQHWGKKDTNAIEPLYAAGTGTTGGYVAVYGRDRCSITQRTLKDLRSRGIDYQYFIIDDEAVANSIHKRMKAAGILTQSYGLPVVDVNGKLSIRPSIDEIESNYRS